MTLFASRSTAPGPTAVRHIGVFLLGLMLGIFASYVIGVGRRASEAKSSAPVAEWMGEILSSADAYRNSETRLYELEKELYRIKLQAIEEILESRLLETESRRQNLPIDKLLLKEVGNDATAITDVEVDSFLKEKQIPVTGETKQKDDIREYLKYRKVSEKRAGYVARLKERAKVHVYLKEPVPPRVAVSTEGFPGWGNPKAAVTLVAFADFQCPFSARSSSTLERLKKNYTPDQIRIVYRDLPLTGHERAIPAAVAARCADTQGKFWEYASLLFENQEHLSEGDFVEYGRKLGLKADEFQKCRDSKKFDSAISQSVQEANSMGIRSTPTFVVNGVVFSGLKSYDEIRDTVDKLLKQNS